MIKFPEKFGLQQKIINEITSAAKENKIEKIFLFGSRARGDFNEKSDIDIAISGGNAAGFCLMINEDVSTLLKFDIVRLTKEKYISMFGKLKDAVETRWLSKAEL